MAENTIRRGYDDCLVLLFLQFQMEYLGMHQQQQQQQPYLPYQMQFPHSDVPPPAPGPMPQDKGTDHWGDPHDKHVSEERGWRMNYLMAKRLTDCSSSVFCRHGAPVSGPTEQETRVTRG